VPDRSRQLWLLPVLLITVIATAVGGLLARFYYEDQGGDTPGAVIPTQTSVPPSERPGTRHVDGTPDAMAHPLYQTVRDVLQRQFDAINAKDYDAWLTTVTAERAEDQPEDVWRTAYRSTQDGSVIIYRIELGDDDDTARVLMTFVSTQDEVDAPRELPADCIQWSVVFPLIHDADSWKLDRSPAGSSPQHERCT
jgi:hypothetical protein